MTLFFLLNLQLLILISVFLMFNFRLCKVLDELLYFVVIVSFIKLTLFACSADIHFPEKFVHVLGAELKAALHFIYPLLIHLIVVFGGKFDHFGFENCNLFCFIQIQLHNVTN